MNVMEVRPREVVFYKLPSGKCPFEEWLASLGVSEQAKVEARIKQVRNSGNLGSHKYLKSRVGELKFAGRYGHLRVYYAEIGSPIMVFCGAFSRTTLSPEQAELQRQKLDDVLSEPGSQAIYVLAIWLNELGLKLGVSVQDEDAE